MLIIANGTNAQCKPKITKICQKKPTRAPPTTGDILNNEVKPVDKALVANETTGPMIKKPTGREINNTKNGTKKF